MPDPFDGFVWAVGEEGSDPVVEAGGAPHRHDQFAQSGHYRHMTEDLRALARLGVDVVRYGMPWRLSEPEPGHYDWTLWDRAFAACHEAGVEPVVDLLHFGLPDHAGRLADTGWIEAFCRYVDAFLARYPEPRWFTPVNEPGVSALLSARFGLWNDRLASETDHAIVLANLVLADLEALARIHADRSARWIGAEGFDCPVALIPEAEDDIDRRRAISWLVWDLHLGLPPVPEGEAYLRPVDERVRDRIADLVVTDNLICGQDVYPTSVQAVGGLAPDWSVSDLVGMAEAELRRWHDRYRQPFWVAETSNLSLPVTQQVLWLREMTSSLARLRSDGYPARGLCWYSRGDQFDWMTALANPTGEVTEVGLFDTDRTPRPIASAFAELTAAGPPGNSMRRRERPTTPRRAVQVAAVLLAAVTMAACASGEPVTESNGPTRTVTTDAAPAAEPTLRAGAAARDLLIGTAVADAPLVAEADYRDMLVREFDTVVAEDVMKWDALRPGPGRFDFEAADRLVDFAEEHDLTIRGHTLVWFNALPDWFEGLQPSRAEAVAMLREHISTVVGRYRGRIAQWDVVNEAIADNGGLRDSPWLRWIGEDYIALAFEFAHRADPDAQLFLNDYDWVAPGSKTDEIIALARTLLADGVPLDGVGIQGHILESFDQARFEAKLAELAGLGVVVAITEADNGIRLPADAAALAAQADVFVGLLDACLAVERCTTFMLWGFTDRHTWIPDAIDGFGTPTPFDADLTPKPAYDALLEHLDS